MKYLKIFEAFDLNNKVIYSKKELENLITYKTSINGIEFLISFYNKGIGVYERVYNSTQSTDFETFNNLAKPIISTISYITNEFIKEYNPKVLEISHISTKKKDKNGILYSVENREDILNKRARLNYHYLSQIDLIKNGIYKIEYFPGFYSTDCFIYKPIYRLLIKRFNENPIDILKR
jgi:hypothetical protein